MVARIKWRGLLAAGLCSALLFSGGTDAWAAGQDLMPDEVIRQYSLALVADPGNPVALQYRASAYLRKGELDKAIADLTDAIHVKPDYAAAYAIRAKAYLQMGKKDMALEDYNQAIGCASNIPTAYYERGNLQGEMARELQAAGQPEKAQLLYEGAISDLNRAIELKPGYAEAWLSRGSIHLECKDYPQAGRDFRMVLKFNPKSETAAAGLQAIEAAKAKVTAKAAGTTKIEA